MPAGFLDQKLPHENLTQRHVISKFYYSLPHKVKILEHSSSLNKTSLSKMLSGKLSFHNYKILKKESALSEISKCHMSK